MTSYRISAQYIGNDEAYAANADRDHILGALADASFATEAEAQAALDAMEPDEAIDAVWSYYVEPETR